MNWNDVSVRIHAHELTSKTSKSNVKSLLTLARKAERSGLSPQLFTLPKMSHLYAVVVSLKQAALDDDIPLMQRVLESAQQTNMTDLRLKLGKKVQEVRVTKAGDTVVAVFTKTQFEKTEFRLRSYMKFV